MTVSPLNEPEKNIVKLPEFVPNTLKINSLQYRYWEIMLLVYRNEYEQAGSPEENFCYITLDQLSDYLGFEPKKEDIERDLDAIRRQSINSFVFEADKARAKIVCGLISQWYVSPLKIGVIFPSRIRKAIEQLDRFQFDTMLKNFPKIPYVKNE